MQGGEKKLKFNGYKTINMKFASFLLNMLKEIANDFLPFCVRLLSKNYAQFRNLQSPQFLAG